MTNTPHNPNQPDAPTEEQLLALLLGESSPRDAQLRQQLASDPALMAKASRLQHAADSLQEALATTSNTTATPPLALDPHRRAQLLAQLSTPQPKAEEKGPRLLNFSHPIWGIGLAACLFFGLSFHLLFQSTGIFSDNHAEMARLQANRLAFPAEAPPPPEHQAQAGSSPNSLEAPTMQLAQMEMLINPAETYQAGKLSFDAFEPQETRARMTRAEDEIRARRAERQNLSKLGAPNFEITDESQNLYRRSHENLNKPATRGLAGAAIGQVFGDIAPSRTLAGTRINTDLKDVGSSITVVTQEFLKDTGATDNAALLTYTTNTETGGANGNYIQDELSVRVRGANGNTDNPSTLNFDVGSSTLEVRNSTPPTPPLFAGYQESGDEEIFELSPFEVTASNNQGYRATSTLSGSRLRDSGNSIDSGRNRYGYFTPYLPKEEEDKNPSRKNLKVTFDRDNAPPRLPFQTTPEPISSPTQNPTPRTQNPNSPKTQNPTKKLRFNLAEGLATPIQNPTTTNPTQPTDSPDLDEPLPKTQNPEPTTSLRDYPESVTASDPQSTFSLNVSDVSYRLAESYLTQNALPPAGTLRTEEFVNAFDYGDPTPTIARKIGFTWERARWPFAHDRDVLRFSLQTAANGRASTQPLQIVLAIDNSGSMSRPDRVEIVKSLTAALQSNLTANDQLSVISFDRTPRLVLDGQPINSKTDLTTLTTQLNPQGGTDLESAINLAYQTANRHFQENAINRVILITDGAANLGNTDAEQLRQTVTENRIRGIALDCFGIGFDGHDDTFLESLSRNGDGRYRFLRTPQDAAAELGPKLAGLLRPAAYDVKVQVEFNKDRVEVYQQLGYQQHQIADQDFRNNAVDAAELAATESGNALYLTKILPDGRGDLGLVRVRYRDANSGTYQELSWNLPYKPDAPELANASPSLRLASVAAAFAALLNGSPLAHAITYADLYDLARPLPAYFPTQTRVQTLPQLINQAQNL